MSNFAATLHPNLERVSTARKTTSKIIDAFSNASYGFWDVSVGFRMARFSGLEVRKMEIGTALEDPSRSEDCERKRPSGLAMIARRYRNWVCPVLRKLQSAGTGPLPVNGYDSNASART